MDTKNLTRGSLLTIIPSMKNSRTGRFRALLTHNAWNLEALAFRKLSLYYYMATPGATSSSAFITVIS